MNPIECIEEAQRQLGLNADGDPGPQTRAAVAAWRAAHRAPEPAPVPAAPPAARPSPGAIVIGDDHWLVGVDRVPLPPNGPLNARFVVEHFTGGAGGASSIEAMRERGVSAHVVVERDGTITQCVPFNRVAYHAGQSAWRDPQTRELFVGANISSIGIEIANGGDDGPGAIAWARNHVPGFASIRAVHRNGGPNSEWECFYDAQIAAVTALTQALVKRYGLRDVTGHDCIAPARKNDPGPAFPMQQIREACGLAGLPEVFR